MLTWSDPDNSGRPVSSCIVTAREMPKHFPQGDY